MSVVRLFLLVFLFSPLSAIYAHNIGFATLSSIFTNKYQFEVLGTEDVTPALYQEALAVFRKLGLKDPEKIKVKRMNTAVLELFKEEREKEEKELHEKGITTKLSKITALATHNAIFIDEDYFLTLSPEKRAFYFGHEAMHIKNKDSVRFIVLLACCLAIIPVGATAAYMHSVAASFAFWGVVPAGLLVAVMAFQRHKEAQADAGGALVAPVVNYVNHIYTNKDMPLIARVKVWLASWLDDYHGQTY